MNGNTVASAMAQARAGGVDRLDAQWMLSAVLSQPRSWLLAHDDARLTDEQNQRITDWVARRASGEPLAYLLGEKEFHGLTLRVSPAVLVPRPDTETLVDWALQLLDSELSAHSSPAVLDLGTGSGAIALAIKHRHPRACVTALDASADALAVARDNAQRLQLDVAWLQSDWWQAVAGRRFNLVVSNPPYIAEGDPHLAALQHEPVAALTSGIDGLNALRHIVAGAQAHLAPGGWLLLEHGYDQAEAIATLLRMQQFDSVATRLDLAGHARCTGGRLA